MALLLQSKLSIFILIGLGNAIISDFSLLKKCIKEKKWEKLKPFFIRISYIIGGIFLVLSSFILVDIFSNFLLVPENSQFLNIDENNIAEFHETIAKILSYTGQILALSFVVSGVSLILSAGNKFLVNLSKIIITVVILYAIIMSSLYYL